MEEKILFDGSRLKYELFFISTKEVLTSSY